MPSWALEGRSFASEEIANPPLDWVGVTTEAGSGTLGKGTRRICGLENLLLDALT